MIFSAHPARYFGDLRERGFAGYVAKPFDLDLLVATLHGFLSPAPGIFPRAGVF